MWPASGLALVLLVRFGAHWWPLIPASELVVAQALGQPLTMGLLGGAAEALEALLALGLLRRFRIRRWFRNVPETLTFCLGVCLVPPVVSAGLGVAGQLAHGLVAPGGWRGDWLTWWLGDAMGLLLVAPLVMTWWPWPLRAPRALLEWSAVAALFVATGLVMTRLAGPHGDLLFFLLSPFVGWLALRFRDAGATSGAVILAGLVFSLSDATTTAETAIYMAFVGMVACMGYLLAAVLSRRDALVVRLRRRADRDALTGLYSRSRLERELHRLRSRRAGARHALIYMDLDHFKLANDTLGHDAADRRLRELAGRLAATLPETALFARVGGDEFSVLLKDTPAGEAERTGERLRLAVLDHPFVSGKHRFRLGASIGIACFGDGESEAAVMSAAYQAQHTAKREGGNRTSVTTTSDHSVKRHRSELAWVSALQRAIDRDELVLFAQRIVPLDDTAEPPWYEVLVRLRRGGKIVSPGAFLPVAERYGMMPALDFAVMNACFRFMATNPGHRFRVNINLAGGTLDHPTFLDTVEGLSARYRVAPRRVCFEVTETIAIHELTRAVEAMRRLNEHGFCFALDDFGAGVANFGYLNQLPVQYVKVDGQFVTALPDDPASRIILRSLNDLATFHGMQCVAEWVGSAAVMTELHQIGVRYAQGFHVHAPEPLADVAVRDHDRAPRG